MSTMWLPGNYREPGQVQRAAIKMLGGRQVIRDGFVSVEPAYGLEVLRSVMDAMREEDVAATDHLVSLLGLDGPGKNLLLGTKKIVRAGSDEGGRIRMVPRIPGLSDDDLSNYSATSDGFENRDVVVLESRALKYSLNSVFTDTTLQDKLCLSSRRLQAARRVATSDPGLAARSLTDVIQQRGFPNCVITAGDYAKSINRYKSVIHQWADTIQYKDTAVPTTVTPDKIHLTYDAFTGVKQWSVHAPLKYAVEALCVYQLAVHYGPEHTMLIIGLETAWLNINIYDEMAGVYYWGSLEGFSSLKGIAPVSSDLPGGLTSDEASSLYRVGAKVLPVVYERAVVGTAVRVSDRHVLVNSHTLNAVSDVGGEAVIAGEPVTTSRSLAYDLSVVDRKGGQGQWSLRDPVVGEKVVLVFSVGDKVEYTEVLRVMSVHQDNLVLSESNVLRKGASGAVVVALKDFAMLGLFVTIRGRDVVCTSFSSRHLMQVTEADSTCSSAVGAESGDLVGDVTYARMMRHGLGSYLDAVKNSVAGVYDKNGKWMGTVANYAGSWRTTVDPTMSQLYLQDRQPLLFEREAADMYVCKEPPPVLTEVPSTRTVTPGERVCILARDGDSVIMSKVSRVDHYTVGARCFLIEDIGDTSERLEGGLVISERDASVLGQYVSRQDDAFGEPCLLCMSVPVASKPAVPELLVNTSPSVIGTCVALLCDEQVEFAEDRRYYDNIGRDALEIFETQHGRKEGSATVGNVNLQVGLTTTDVLKAGAWLLGRLEVRSSSLVAPDVLMDRYSWLMGYLFVEQRLLYDEAVCVLYGITGPKERDKDDLTPLSASSTWSFSRSTTPRLVRSHTDEIEKLQGQIDRLVAKFGGSDVSVD